MYQRMDFCNTKIIKPKELAIVQKANLKNVLTYLLYLKLIAAKVKSERR